MDCSRSVSIWQSLVGIAVILFSVGSAPAQVTNIQIGSSTVQPSVKRLGINLGGQDYYDSGQMTKNLVFRNPGFEGETYQSTIRCGQGTAGSCTDENVYSAWPASFWSGATFEFFYGAAQGQTGTVSAYTGANGAVGGVFTFSTPVAPAAGDYMIVRKTVPGNAGAGWWPSTSGGGAISTNFTDLPPGTTGTQTVVLNAPSSGSSAALASYFDSTNGISFVQLNGTFQLSFKAKASAGTNSLAVSVMRFGSGTYLSQTVNLTSSWTTYNLSFNASENGTAVGTVAVNFATVGQDTVLMDDVSLVQMNSDPSNATAFRDPVIGALKTLNPGVLRFWAGQLGDTLDNLIADPYGRKRAGFSAWSTEQDDVFYGLHEFLQLCESLGAEPWFVVPATFNTTDAANLIEYLAGSSSTPYGAKRATRGHPNPWTLSFSKIHLEFGNEAWNSTFKGGSIEYSAPYGGRAQTIFAAMRADGAYTPSAFDLVLGGQAVWSGRNQEIQDYCNNNDSFAVAPYMMSTVDSFSTVEDLYGSTFAEAEAYLSPSGAAEGVSGGLMSLNQQAIQSSTHPVPVVLYEMNMGTVLGTITQTALNSYASSLGAGLAVADSMLQQMRAGILTQNLFALPQYEFLRSDNSTVFLWGSVIDMGVTDRRRPQFLALQMANQAIGNNAAMLQTVHSGADPTWNQPLVNTVQLNGAHYLESFAFSSGSQRSLIVFNLHRTASLPVTFSGSNSPSGSVQLLQLTSNSLSDTNEKSSIVNITNQTQAAFVPSSALSLPPYSMTLLVWTAGTTNPLPVITSVAASAVTGTTATITWTTDQASSSQVAYGTTTGYGSLSALNSAAVTSHLVTLGGLSPGTTYDYAVNSAAAAGTATSGNFTFSTPAGAPPIVTPPIITPPTTSVVSRVGGAHNSTGTSNTPTSLTIPYTSSNSNTLVAVCALGSTSSSIGSITDTGGSAWIFRAFVSNGTAVRSEIWSTAAGGSIASTSFTVQISGGTPTSCALEEYSGVLGIGATATNQATSGSMSVSLAAQEKNDFVVAGLGANSFNGYTATSGTIEQNAGLTFNSSTAYVEMMLCDNTSASATTVTCAALGGTSPWAAPALELRPVSAGATLPFIGSVTSTGVTTTSATITWTTDQPSSSQVAYGTTTGYGSLSALNSTTVTLHSVTLAGLSPGTTYDYAVSSATTAGTSTSANFSFSTPTTTPVITLVKSAGITSTSATITWTTDQASTAQVEYGSTPAYGSLSGANPSLATLHSATLAGLTPGTTYNYAVLSANSSAMLGTSANFTFATTGTPAPVITSVGATGITATSATITWTTDQASSSQVEFGSTPAYGSLSALSSSLGTSHTVNVTGLTAGITYNYAALSANSSATLGTSANFTFATTAAIQGPAPNVGGVAFWGVNGTGATIAWTTDQASTTAVQYGTTMALGQTSPIQPALTTSHGVIMNYLASQTTYYFRAQSTNSGGVSGYSPIYSFTTPDITPPTISNVTATPAANHTASISWSLSEAATTQIEYGTNLYYGSWTWGTSGTQATLSWVPSGMVHFRLHSTDPSGNQTVSPDYTFTEP